MLSTPLHKSVFSIFCIPFCLGIIVQHFCVLPQDYTLYAVLTCFVLLSTLQLVTISTYSRLNTLKLGLLLAFSLCIGAWHYSTHTEQHNYSSIKTIDYVATIQHTPIPKANSFKIEAMIDSACYNSNSIYIKSKALCYFEKSPQVLQLNAGEIIHFRARLNSPTPAQNPEDFDYKQFLAHRGIFATCYVKNEDWNSTGRYKNTIKTMASRAQNYVIELIKQLNYESEEQAILCALTVGYKQDIDDELQAQYAASGSTHILAVSGLHTGILFIFLSRLFRVFGKKRIVIWLKTVIIIFTLWGFAFITGLSPSVSRAALMFSLISIGQASKQQSNIYNNIFISAFILLAINPHTIFELGFQLSYTAVLGIVSFQPHIAQFLSGKLHLPRKISDLASVSIAAQLGTAPISIHTFYTFPLYFIITNIWIIPLVGFIIIGAIVLIFACALGIPCGLLSIPLGWMLQLMNGGVEIISQFWNAQLNFLYLNSSEIMLVYAFLILMLLAYKHHSKRLLFASLLPLFLFSGIRITHTLAQKENHRMFVFQDRESFNISAQQGNRSTVLYENDTLMLMPSYFIHHHLSYPQLDTAKVNHSSKYYNLEKRKDFVISPVGLHCIYSKALENHSKKMNINTLFIDKEEPKSIYTFYKHLAFQELVIFKRPQKHINYYRNFCNANNIKLHLVYQDGAYISEWNLVP